MNELMNDSDTLFFYNQLRAIKTQTYDQLYPELKSFRLIPIERDIPAGATTIGWWSYDKVGVAKIIADGSGNIPRIELTGIETISQIRQIAIAYGYTTEEIRNAQFTGIPLSARKAIAARDAIERKMDAIAWSGDAAYGLKGFLTLDNVPTADVVNNAGATSKHWENKTPAEILFDVTDAIGDMLVLTKEVERPDTMLIPTSSYVYISGITMPYGTETVLQFLERNLVPLGITTIDTLPLLETAGASSTKRMALYKNDRTRLAQQITLDFIQYAPQQKSLEFDIPCEAKHGGVLGYRPLSISFRDAI